MITIFALISRVANATFCFSNISRYSIQSSTREWENGTNEDEGEGKPDLEKINLINQLEEEDKQTVFKIIDTMLTKKKFKDFFNKNISAL